MNALGVAGYGAAGVAFLVLTALLTTGWRGRGVGARLIIASAVTAAWGLLLAADSRSADLPLVGVYAIEVARDVAWLLVLTQLAHAAAARILIIISHVVWIGAVVLGVAVMVPQIGLQLSTPSLLLSRIGLALTLVGLVLLEQIYRNSPQSARRTLRYFVAGVGGMLAYDLFLYSQAELVRGIAADAWNVRGVIFAFAAPLIAVAVRRNPQWRLDIFVSRHVIFYTTTFVAVGVYLVVMALAGYVIREQGGTWGRVGQILFFAGAAVVLVSLITSGSLRRQAIVFISKHFFRNKYDYRIEWLRFIATLSATGGDDIRGTLIRAVAQIFASPGGILFVLDEQARQFVPVASWPIRLDTIDGIAPLGAASELANFVRTRQWIVDLQEYRRLPDVYQNIELPPWFATNPALRIVSPVLELERLTGFFVLYEPPPPFDLTYEDRDLLKTVGRHAAIQLAQHEADSKLAEGRQFEAYSRLTAFMMHDLKNSVAQLGLVVTNAERHKRNPEFIDDAIGTIANAVERMSRLIEQLRGVPQSSSAQTVRLDELVNQVVARCSLRVPAPTLQHAVQAAVKADPERLTAVLEHVVRNAQDAAPEGSVSLHLSVAGEEAILVVEDTGKGMDAEFVRERLFRPFDGTKGSKGMGIGAYQTRAYVQSLGGHVEVQSSPARGTTFSIILPVAPAAAAVQAQVTE